MTDAERRPLEAQYGDLHACPACGAHRWGQTQIQWLQDVVECGECLLVACIEAVRFAALVGRD